MDAIQLIESNLDVEEILRYYHFDSIRPSGNYIRSACKVHGGNSTTAFVINQENGLWSCHTGNCGSGNVFQLVQKLEDCTFPESVHKIATILGLDINDLQIVAQTKQERKELKAFIEAIESFRDKELTPYQPSGQQRIITKLKDFSIDTIHHFGAVYFDEFQGKTSNNNPLILRDFVGFPIIFKGMCIGYSLRSAKGHEYLKWVHQPPNIMTSEILYNYDNIIGKSKVVVVEGITDVWAYHEVGIPAVATYGAKISEAQKRLLLQLGADLVFSFDGDEAGRNASKKAYDMFKYTTNIQFVHLPNGADPENIPREELINHYEQKRNTCNP